MSERRIQGVKGARDGNAGGIKNREQEDSNRSPVDENLREMREQLLMLTCVAGKRAVR